MTLAQTAPPAFRVPTNPSLRLPSTRSPSAGHGGTFLDRPDLLPRLAQTHWLPWGHTVNRGGSGHQVEMAAIVTQQPLKSPLLLTSVKAPPPSPHSCPIHTSAHQPATPATLLVTLHIPPHNPTCSFTPGSCRLPPSPSQALWITTPIETHPHSRPNCFLPFAQLSALHPALPARPGSSCSTIPSPLANKSPAPVSALASPAWLLLARASVSSVI